MLEREKGVSRARKERITKGGVVFFFKGRKERIVGHFVGTTCGFPWCFLCPFVHLLVFKVAHP